MSTEQVRLARTEGEPLLSVENPRTSFYTDKEVIRAVDGISFDIFRGEAVGIVGESGSGESVTAHSIMRLVEKPGHIENDRIIYDGENLLDKSAKQIRSIRGGSIAMVFQDPLASLNPVYTVGNQIEETLRPHRGLNRLKATKETIELLETVGVPDMHRRVREHPYQLSGGMCQHVVIVMTLAYDPEPPICDEPTTTLGVTIQAQILELLEELQKERSLDIMFTAHDMDVIAEMADRVNVMYADEIVESTPVVELFESPKHPYTQGLLNSTPGQGLSEDERLATIEGDAPTPNKDPTYCRFAPWCLKVFAECDTVHPESVEAGDGTGQRRASYLLYPDDPSTEGVVTVRREDGQRGGSIR